MARKPMNAYEYIIYLLTRREYSEQEIIKKLKAKEFDPEEAAEALKKVKDLNFQSDERFTENFIRAYAESGYGPFVITQKLMQKGIKSEYSSEMMEQMNIDWYEVARNYFEFKRFHTRDFSDFKEKQKTLRNLVSRGFSFDIAKQTMEDYLSGDFTIDEFAF